MKYKLSTKERMKLFYYRVKFFSWFMFSHHPLCKNYRQELFKINSFYICRGCTLFYSSFLVLLLYLILTPAIINVGLINLFLITNLLAFPSFFGSIIKTSIRPVKDLYRVSLGMAVAIPFGVILIVKDFTLIFILVLLAGLYFTAFKFLRRQTNHEHLLCENCVDLTNKACEPYKKSLKAERDHSVTISDYIQQKIRANPKYSKLLENKLNLSKKYKND